MTIDNVLRIFLGVIIGLMIGIICLSHAAAQTPTSKWWYSSDASRIAINSETGAMQAIFPGSAIVCSQKSKSEKTNVQCYTVFLAQVIPQ